MSRHYLLLLSITFIVITALIFLHNSYFVKYCDAIFLHYMLMTFDSSRLKLADFLVFIHSKLSFSVAESAKHAVSTQQCIRTLWGVQGSKHVFHCISTGREKTDISIKENMSQIMTLQEARVHQICPLPVWAAEPSRGGWMDPGPPHVRSRSYCSVERERARECATPSADPHAHPPLSTTSFSQSSQTQRVWVVWTQLVDRPWALPNKQSLGCVLMVE